MEEDMYEFRFYTNRNILIQEYIKIDTYSTLLNT